MAPTREPTAARADEPQRWSVQTLAPREYPAWDQALAGSPQDCIFLHSGFLDVLREALGWRVELLGCYERDQLVGGATGLITEDARGSCLDRIVLVPYNGCWTLDGPAESPHRIEHRRHAIASALADEIGRLHRSAVIDLHPTNDDVRPFTWQGWSAAVRYTYLTDLTRLEDGHFTPDVRRRVKKAVADAVQFDRDVSPVDFVRLWASSLVRQGLTHPVPAERLRQLLETIQQSFRCEIHGARLSDGRLAAANVLLYDNTTAYYWLAGFDPDLPGDRAANQFCHVETLREAARHAERFDWVGANTPRVAYYKQAYGPELTPCYRLSWCKAGKRDDGSGLHRFRRWFSGRSSRRADHALESHTCPPDAAPTDGCTERKTT